ncbi:MAG: methyltransferase domain-containing protein [Caldilineaceae bacterium]
MSSSNRQGTMTADEQYTHNQSSQARQRFGTRVAEVQAAFLIPHLRPGMMILDCGCGPGSITFGLAEIVAPGEVIGIDISEKQIEQAQSRAVEQQVANVRFETADMYALPFTDQSFDAIFSNAVFHHLRDPLAALKGAYRLLKPEGVLGIREPDFAGLLVNPAKPILLRYFERIVQLITVNGGNPSIGRTLRALLQEAGLTNINASAMYETYGTQDAVHYIGTFAVNMLREETYITQLTNLSGNPMEVDEIREAWTAWADNPNAFLAEAWCQAIGWKAL